jgi:hypothetical protein
MRRRRGSLTIRTIVGANEASSVKIEQSSSARSCRTRDVSADSLAGYTPGEAMARVHQLESAIRFLVECESLRPA